ncbi:uncharacterized protein LOC108101613 [Drosophila ficusphila]|uniref:uncharacterized protein LOC108101613 n=1 Tax=Drosophila ficusphila TaxID=30025 RepID=UPI0007E72E4D|nr:uncharacterized protein LOC108101613 [Drosophila ficusphila]
MAGNKALLICCFVVMVASDPTDVDCNLRQDLSALKNCCAYPKFMFEEFQNQCGRYMPAGAPRISPCLYECIFNVTNTLVDSAIHPHNTKLMLERLVGPNPEFQDAYLNGLLSCTETVKEIMRERKPRKTDQCSPIAVLYGVCARKHVFNHCPSSSWSGTETCEKARLQNLNCQSSKASRGYNNRLI